VQNISYAAIIKSILADPSGFYVNVHTADFPNGAIRGQLMPAVRMTGAQEVPGPGARTGVGIASIWFNGQPDQVCYTMQVTGIRLPAAAAHIHKGAPGVAGPVVIPLATPDRTGFSSGCVTADPALVADIQANPINYYFNVHTSDFPNGAARGQLSH